MNLNKDHFEGKVLFHKKAYDMNINKEFNRRTIKVPFPVIGITDDEILVRVSGPSGVYTQEYIQFKGQSKCLEIESDNIFYEASNSQGKLDTIEIFVK